MPPRIAFSAVRTVAFRPKSTVPQKRFAPCLLQQRAASDDAVPKRPDIKPTDPRMPENSNVYSHHVSEEQAAIDKTMGETPPDISQGTPVQEILQRDQEAKDKAPQVLKQEMNKSSPSGTRSYSTSARRSAAELATVQFEDTRAIGLQYPGAGFGHKFPLPDPTKRAKTDHFKHRYDPVVDQVTKSLMRDGKLSRAQAHMAEILNTLRTAPSPQGSTISSGREILASIPREAFALEPIQYLTAVLDSVAPLVKIRQQKGVLGGGASMPVPVPLTVKQRRRQAIQWILAAAEKRREPKLAERIAKEIIGIAEGRSSAWERRGMVHKMAISARANVRSAMQRKRVKRKVF